MKKDTVILTGASLAGFVLFLLVVGGGFRFAQALTNDSTAFARQVLTETVADWDPEPILSRAHPDFLKVSSREDMQQLFGVINRRLGPLEAYEGELKILGVQYVQERGTQVVLAQSGRFAHGKGTVTLTLVSRGGVWQVLGIHVNSPQLVAS